MNIASDPRMISRELNAVFPGGFGGAVGGLGLLPFNEKMRNRVEKLKTLPILN